MARPIAKTSTTFPTSNNPAAPEIVILVGLPASGKTTFRRERFGDTHVPVSKDDFPHNRNKNRRQMQLVSEALAAGKPVIVDNTNPRREDRAPLIKTARSWGVPVRVFFFEPDVEGCKKRNKTRQGKEHVPDVAIYSAAKYLEPPEKAEGIDDLYAVRLTEKEFQVRREELRSQ